ncbi:MAG: DUF1905 domain-containing protein [Flavobacteriales bacterium]
MPRRTKDTIRYTTPLERFDGRFAWWYVEFPHDTELVFGKRGTIRVKCLINGVATDRALMPRKSGCHIIILGGDIRRKAGLKKVGQPVDVELWLDPEPDKLDRPEALAETLDFLPEMKAAWKKLTPGMQRSMCYWVGSAKTEATQAKRVAELLRRFESGDFQVGRPSKK